MLLKINRTLEKMMPFITPTSVIIGIFLSVYLKDFSFLVPWLFAFMTFEGSLTMNFRSLKSIMSHPLPIFIILGFLHIALPLWAWSVGHIVFSGDSFTITGLILAMVIPTGVTSFIWVSMKNGNKPLTLAIILIDSLLSPFVVPYSLSLLVGQKVELDILSMMTGLLCMIVLPSIAGMLLNELTKGKIAVSWKPRLSPISKVFLSVVVMLNGAVIAPYFTEFQWKLVVIIVTVFFLSFTGYLFAYLLGKLLKYDQEMLVSMTFSGGMRNISAGAVIAISYFPSAVIFPVVAGMLFQQILASIFANILDKNLAKKEEKHTSITA